MKVIFHAVQKYTRLWQKSIAIDGIAGQAKGASCSQVKRFFVENLMGEDHEEK